MKYRVFKIRPGVDPEDICNRAGAVEAHIFERECFIAVKNSRASNKLRLITVERSEYIETREQLSTTVIK
jgi:hypothetical protein